MTATVLGDVIVPEVFNKYVINRTAELSALWTSGLVAPVEGVSVPDGGDEVNMPFWHDLTGNSQVLSTGTNLTVGNITADKDVAAVLARALVYGARDLAGALAGDDPMSAIGDLVATKWARDMQTTLISSFKGSMGALALVPSNTFDISGLSGANAVFDAEAFIDACGQLGDAEGGLTAVAVHSATLRLMKKLDLIDFALDSEGKPTIPFYQGKRVIVDDGMPVTGGNYTSIIFGPGAIGYAEGSPKVPSEVERNALVGGGEEYLVSRRHFVLHPRGIKWQGDPALDTASNAELETAGNWAKVYEAKQIRMVRFVHKIYSGS